jgi:hypothetical protein
VTAAEWEALILETQDGHVARLHYVGTDAGPMVEVEREAPDRDPPHAVKTWRTGFLLPLGPSVDGPAFLLRCLDICALHEVREQFTVRGCRLYDPHAVPR